MDNPVWPDTLPQEPYWADNGTPEYVPNDNTIRTTVTAGPAKVRRRFTAVPEECKLQMWMTTDQLATLKDFVQNVLEEVLPFTWVDFRTDEQATYRFMKGWSSVGQKYDSGDIWMITLDLELLP